MDITGAKPTVVPWKDTPLKSTQKEHEMALRQPAVPRFFTHTVSEYIFFSNIFRYKTLDQRYKALDLKFLGLVLYFMDLPANLIFRNGLVPKSVLCWALQQVQKRLFLNPWLGSNCEYFIYPTPAICWLGIQGHDRARWHPHGAAMLSSCLASWKSALVLPVSDAGALLLLCRTSLHQEEI